MAVISKTEQGTIQASLKRERNREKQRIWRENHRERYLEIKRNYARKVRGTEPERYFTNKSINAFGERKDDDKTTEVSICKNCARTYLQKLHCIWCNQN